MVRYGKLCHEYYPEGPAQADQPTENFSATKTLGAVVTGIAAWETRDLPRTGRKTGPIQAEDRVDHWLDEFSFNPDAHLEHVLAMIAHNPDLSYGHRGFSYDTFGDVQINRLSDVVTTAIAQDPERLGTTVEEFTQRYLFQPLGMRHSQWSGGVPDKNYAFTWSSTTREMARLGLLLLHGGVWSGERILGEDWVYAMTHPSFEDANPAYGYLTWLNTLENDAGTERTFDCAPLSVNFAVPARAVGGDRLRLRRSRELRAGEGRRRLVRGRALRPVHRRPARARPGAGRQGLRRRRQGRRLLEHLPPGADRARPGVRGQRGGVLRCVRARSVRAGPALARAARSAMRDVGGAVQRDRVSAARARTRRGPRQLQTVVRSGST